MPNNMINSTLRSSTFMAHLDSRAAACGYSNYSAQHVTYPPKGLLPLPGNSVEAVAGCDLWDQIFDAALLINPAFDIYRIFDTVSSRLNTSLFISLCSCSYKVPDSVGCSWLPVSQHPGIIGYCSNITMRSGSFEQVQVAPVYFDRQDVKKALHAPLNVTWSECSNRRVFPHGDGSLPSFTVLPNVIEKSERTVVVHGLADFILIAEG